MYTRRASFALVRAARLRHHRLRVRAAPGRDLPDVHALAARRGVLGARRVPRGGAARASGDRLHDGRSAWRRAAGRAYPGRFRAERKPHAPALEQHCARCGCRGRRDARRNAERLGADGRPPARASQPETSRGDVNADRRWKGMTDRKRWLALYMLCVGELMIVLDTTVVNVALPSIREDLGFGETSLVWVVNAYMVTYGGFLLLGGRLGDLYGQRRLFLLGTSLFTFASVLCGLAGTREILVAARAVQGLGGAVVSAI